MHLKCVKNMQTNDLKIVIADNASPFINRVNAIFMEEIFLRSNIKLPVLPDVPESGSYILIDEINTIQYRYPALAEHLLNLKRPGSEGFLVSVIRTGVAIRIVVAGADGRGCLYGAARILRKLSVKDGSIIPTDELADISVTPKYPLRGHQLAYRDKQNTCPCWDIDDFDRYIRDLALFGSNAIEIVPPRTDDRLFSPVFRRDPFEMMAELSRIIHSYGMDVWLWYPNMGTDYGNPDVYAAELREREKVFSSVPYIDNVLIPAGDPGELHPRDFFPFAGDSVKILHKYHPAARVWIAPQSSQPEPGWYDAFYGEVRKEPGWLYGLCYAPWVMDTIREMRDCLPEKYKNRIRHYPDITHNSSSQFEVPDWDVPFALTLGREGNNTRPRAMKHIHNLHAQYTVGSLTYSEGVHDDVNKMVWGDQDFNPDTQVEETVRDYVRLFIDPDIVSPLSELILKTEDNWVGYAAGNENINEVYNGFNLLDSSIPDKTKENYRYQMALLRALSDYQAKIRYVYDTRLENEAIESLMRAPETGSREAIRNARSIFHRTGDEPVEPELRRRIQRLADSLYEKCRIKLTTTRHNGQSWIRGAYLDSLDLPLNDFFWYNGHFKRIWNLPTEEERLNEINKLITRTDPGEGGFYDWLGDIGTFKKRVMQNTNWEDDPGFLRSPVINHDPYGLQMLAHSMAGWHNEFPVTLRWFGRARVIYGTPLQVRYNGLDPDSDYKLRVSIPLLAGAEKSVNLPVRFYIGERMVYDTLEINPYSAWNPVYEYDIPRESYCRGSLSLTWQTYDTLNAFGVSEIWIIKQRTL